MKRYERCRPARPVSWALICLLAAGLVMGAAGPAAAQQTGFMGEIRLWAGLATAPHGWAFCDGQELNISEYQTLYALMGTTYGGDGQTTFALPDLRGRTAMGAGTGALISGDKLSTRTLGQQPGAEQGTISPTGNGRKLTIAAAGGNSVDIQPPSMVVPYIICISGLDPGRETDQYAFIGEVRLTAAATAPDKWLLCQGQTLNISEYHNLSLLIWTTYGGNGQTTFALPDMRSRMVMGDGTGVDSQGVALTQRIRGETGGEEFTDLYSTQEGQLYSVGVPRPDSDGNAFSIVPPVLVLNYMICHDGIYPNRH